MVGIVRVWLKNNRPNFFQRYGFYNSLLCSPTGEEIEVSFCHLRVCVILVAAALGS